MTERRFTVGADAGELALRSRRGELLSEEQARLDRALQASSTLRLSYQMGRDFDDAQRVQPGDDALIARATERVLQRSAQRGRTGRRRVWWLTAAAVFVAVGAAAAASVLLVEFESAPQRAARSVPLPATGSKGHSRASRGADTDTAEAAPKRAPVPAEPAPLASSRAASEKPQSEQRSRSVPRFYSSAAELFREANAKRRVDDLRSASALYAELQARFPGTHEARVSHVSLGKLQLAAGRAREADRQFRRYLAAGGGHLNEEALVGRAEALSRLGETDEERRVWQRLQASHPASVYRARAHERLEALGALERKRSR